MDEMLSIRPAGRADLPAVLELYGPTGLGDDQVLSVEAADRRLVEMGAHADCTLFVAEMKGRVVGTFTLLVAPKLAHMGGAAALVDDVVVREDLRGKGIGKAMMEFAMRRAAERGCYKLALSSQLRREEAHRFYESLGFRRHGYSFAVDLTSA